MIALSPAGRAIWVALAGSVVVAAALVLWDFVVGPWYWRRRFAERGEREVVR